MLIADGQHFSKDWWIAGWPLSGSGQSNSTPRSSRVASLKGIVDLRTLSGTTFKEAVVEMRGYA